MSKLARTATGMLSGLGRRSTPLRPNSSEACKKDQGLGTDEVPGGFIEVFMRTFPGHQLLPGAGDDELPTPSTALASRRLLKSASFGSSDLKPKMLTPWRASS